MDLKCLNKQCNKTFSVVASSKRKYCSQKCYWADKKSRGLIPPSRKGAKLTIKHKQILSKYNKGRIHNDTMRKKSSIAKLGKNNPMYGKIGDKHPNWVGNKIKHFDKRIRHCSLYIQWRSNIFQRDGWICQTCGVRGGKLQVHHIKSFAEILQNNHIKTFEQAINCKELWNLDNGITLCEDCHKLTQSYKQRIIK